MLYYVFNMLSFMCLFIIMSISVRLHELWCTVRDMCLRKCSIIIIISIVYNYMQLSLMDFPSTLFFLYSYLNKYVFTWSDHPPYIYMYIYIKQDENSMMSWSTNFYYYNYNTTQILGNPVTFLSGTMLADKTMIN